jgi:quinone-modifying oxidoreductase subunit QmoB
MDKKYGVYICEGCGIGESLDVKALCGVPEEEGCPTKTHPSSVWKGRGRAA